MARRTQGAAEGRQYTVPRAWRSLKNTDFAAALAAPAMARSPHFALHHVAAAPASALWRPRQELVPEISTAGAPKAANSVDNISPPVQLWFGLVVPKRHARRAVTRVLLKRQMRAKADRCCGRLPPGQWLIRLRAPFDARLFRGASSTRLREAARSELEFVFGRVVPA